MTQPFPRQPTDVWVHTAAMMVRGELTNDGVISSDEAIAWLAALETATLEALHALDNIQQVLTEATSGPAAEHYEESSDEGRQRTRTLGGPGDASTSD